MGNTAKKLANKRNLLLTGVPGSGKTTAILEILRRLPDVKAGGFFTAEIRSEAGRVGFKLITLDGREETLAHLDFPGRDRVGRYKVNTAVLDTLAVDTIHRAMAECALVVVDEIGPLETLSRKVKLAVAEALDGDKPVLGTIARARGPFMDVVRARPDLTLLEVRRDNQDQIIAQAVEWLKKATPPPANT